MDKPADSGSVFRGSNPLRGTGLDSTEIIHSYFLLFTYFLFINIINMYGIKTSKYYEQSI